MTPRHIIPPEATVAEDKSLENLYSAVTEYIEARGGRVVVIGGVEVQRWPVDRNYIYRLAIKITGRSPRLQKVKDDAGGRK